jgi:cytochrome c-type biogenesis protein CcmF
VLPALGIGLAILVMTGSIIDLVERTTILRAPISIAWLRAKGLPRSTWGTAVAHFGLGLLLLGVIGESQWGSERIVSLKPSDKVSIAGYELTFDGVVPRTGPNYRDFAAHFTVQRNGELVGTMEPSKRTFPSRGTTTTEAALMTRGVSQLYVSLGDQAPDGGLAVRIYHKPMVLLIWLSAVVMVIGGALSLSDRRLRVGAPRPARTRVAAQPAE